MWLTPAFSTPAVCSRIFHPCNYARAAFSTPAFSVAPFCCLWRDVETSCDKHFVVVSHHQQSPPLILPAILVTTCHGLAAPCRGVAEGWTYPPHFCQRSFLRLMQIRRVFTEGGSQSGCQRVQNTKRFYNDSESAITHRCCLSVLRVCVCRQTAYTNTIFSKTKQLRVYGLYWRPLAEVLMGFSKNLCLNDIINLQNRWVMALRSYQVAVPCSGSLSESCCTWYLIDTFIRFLFTKNI